MSSRGMTCAALGRWLDEGMPPESEAAARAHTTGCEACHALVEAQREIDLLLSRAGATLANHARFVDRVMERVSVVEQPATRVELWPATPLPWWIQAATDPAAVLACALAALLAWKIDWLLVLSRFVGDRWGRFASQTFQPTLASWGFDRPGVVLGLSLLGLLLIGWLSFHLYRWSERLTRRSAGV
jgi:anti-sigma factor RsiW